MTYHLLASFCILTFNGSRKDFSVFKQHYKFIISILFYFFQISFFWSIHFFLTSFLSFFHPSIQSFQIFNVHSFISFFWSFIIFINFHHFPHPSIQSFNFIVFLNSFICYWFYFFGVDSNVFWSFLYSPSADHCGTLENSNFQLKQLFIRFESPWSVHVQNIQIY